MSEPPAGSGLQLLIFDSVKHRDGRGLNRPWLQELPDPISTVMWQSWLQMAELDALALGVVTGEWVTVTSENGSVETPVVVLPTVRPGVVEAPRGYGAGAGRFAEGRGANVLDLLPAKVLSDSNGARAMESVRVEVAKAASSAERGKVAIYGRGLRQSEHLPRGWGSHDTVRLRGPNGASSETDSGGDE